MPKNSICYVEWYSTDLNRTRKFLSGLFRWKFKVSTRDYWMFFPPSGIGGGIQKVPRVRAGKSPLVYVLVDRIGPHLKKAPSLGGAVAVPRTEIPTYGWFALLKDPDGNIVGLFENRRR